MLLSFKNIYFFKLSDLRPRGVRIIGKLFEFKTGCIIKIDIEINVEAETLTSCLFANGKQALIAEQIGYISAITLGGKFKRPFESVRVVLQTCGDVGITYFFVRGYDIHQIARFQVFFGKNRYQISKFCNF